MTKLELVAKINRYPGPVVTTRARKDTLVEILNARMEEEHMENKMAKNPWALPGTLILLGVAILVVMALVQG